MRNSSDKSGLCSVRASLSIFKPAHSILSSGLQTFVAVVSCSSRLLDDLGRQGRSLSRRHWEGMSSAGEIVGVSAYSSSQLNNERASVVSTCFTKSVCNRYQDHVCAITDLTYLEFVLCLEALCLLNSLSVGT